MQLQRIYLELQQAREHFPNLEALPTDDGGVYAKAALQTSAGKVYLLAIYFQGYPNEMPKVFVTKPTLSPSKHKYTTGAICYMHPNMWNPGRHDVKFVLFQAAVWLNKYEVYLSNGGRWPGPGIEHNAS
jgi:hypothetical protein